MAVKAILKMGHPELFKRSKEVRDFGSVRLKQIIKDLEDSREFYEGAGLSAPQIGYFERVFIFGFEHNSRYPNEKPIPKTIFINPTIKPLTEFQDEYWEGCLSVPGIRALIQRHTKIAYQAYTTDGDLIEGQLEGFPARVVQHEYDHIEGILFPQRVKDFHQFGFEDELKDVIFKP